MNKNLPNNPVVAVIKDEFNLVLNRGESNGIKRGDRFVVFTLSKQDIIDPVTSENLGKLELPRGTGIITHVQEKMSILTSDMKKKSTSINIFSGPSEEEMPFANPKIGDLTRPV